jgi:Ca-activated chloride channel family protein
MLLVDLSGSMATPDFSFGGKNMDRLDVVKRVAGDFISHRQGDRIGLILFGTKPYLHVPLTFDTDYVKNALDNATIGLAGEFTAMGDAIGLAVNHLRNEEKNSRVIILLTDGASNTGALSPDQASLIAKQAGIRIYTIGIGADRLIVTTPFGEQIINPSADLDEDALMRIAKTTGGEFFRAKNTEKLKNIYTQINQLETVNKNNVILRPVTALYQWPLGVAFCLSLFYATRRVTRVLQYG